jgi:hypothetical protein
MTCDFMEYPPGVRAPTLSLENVQIVNGGQTSHALFEAARREPDRVKNVLVLVRVYQTKQREISLRIAASTNSQTPIRSRDLRANDDVQRKLADAFASMGYFYERKAQQHKDEDLASRIDAQAAGQVYVAYFLGLPQVAGKDRGKIFGDLYDEIFNDQITAQRILTAIAVFTPIERMKRKLQKSIRSGEDYDVDLLFLIDGAFHLLYAVSHLCELRGIDPTDSVRAETQLDDGVRVLKKAVVEERQQDVAFAHKRFFKSERARARIHKAAAELVEQDANPLFQRPT